MSEQYPATGNFPEENHKTSLMRSIRWRAIAVGVVADILTTMVLWSLYASVLLAEKVEEYGGIDKIPEQSLSQEALLALGLIGTIGTVVGGYIAGRKALREETRHGIAVAVVSLLLGLGLELAVQGAIRLQWWEIPFLVLMIPAGALGGYLAQGRRGSLRRDPAG